MYWLNDMYDCRYSDSICLLEYHHIHIQHSQLHLPQSNVISMSSLYFPATLCTDQYILVSSVVWTTDIQVHTHHTSFQSLTGTISFATRTSLLPTICGHHPSSLQFPLLSAHLCEACHVQTATTMGWPRRRYYRACHPQVCTSKHTFLSSTY